MSCSAICMRLAVQGRPKPARPGQDGPGRDGPVPGGPVHDGSSAQVCQHREGEPLDVARLRASFAPVAVHGDQLPLFFYADLFLKHPEVRDMFPMSMAAQRDHLVQALVKIVSQVDSGADVNAFLQGLARDHRKFGAMAEHYGAVGSSLLATLEPFSGPA